MSFLKRMYPMAQVAIKCPHTARPFLTGIQCDPAEFKLLSDVLRATNCSACGMVHSWRPSEAWLVDGEGSPMTKAPALLRKWKKGIRAEDRLQVKNV